MKPRQTCFRFALCLHLLLAALTMPGEPAAAMSVSPTHLEMTSAGPNSRADIRVFNNADKPLPIETVVSRVTRDADGNEVIKREDADFLVLPLQTMIPPGGSQVLKVQWLGEPLIEESRAYRIAVKQLPVAQPGERKSVQLVLKFSVIVNVAPPEGRPALRLVRAGIARSRKGKRIPRLTVTNPSRVHARLPEARVQLSGGDWRKILSPGMLQGLLGIGTVMPGQTRSFDLPLPLPDSVQSLNAQIDYPAQPRR